MQSLPAQGTTIRPAPFRPRGLARLTMWVQERRRGRRPLMTVTASDFGMYWGALKSFFLTLEVGRLALWKFASFQLRFRLVSTPGVWTDAGTKTVFSPSLLTWNCGGLAEGEDYVFELTVTETSGVVTVTELTVNVGFS